MSPPTVTAPGPEKDDLAQDPTPGADEANDAAPTTGASEAASEDLEVALIDRMKSLSPPDFERLVGQFLEAKGLSDVRITQRSHDGDLDGDGVVSFFSVRVAFQAKRYQAQKMGVDPVAAFKRRIVDQYDRGVFITTSSFTPGAREVAEQPVGKVILLDGDQLVAQMVELGLGVTKVPVLETRLDEKFFSGFGEQQ